MINEAIFTASSVALIECSDPSTANKNESYYQSTLFMILLIFGFVVSSAKS
ncbi:MAG TPA: hypothetical protein VK072_00550 [Candidatus Avamphibacillus sp.]|nr:hypothetical protein [Candidatus Avamphibacillus sp.]